MKDPFHLKGALKPAGSARFRRLKAMLFGLLCATCLLPVARAGLPVVAVHDSELTRALESQPAIPPTPSGAGTTGFQWWPTNWHYFVIPDSVKEALRADGTAFATVSDADISAGHLLDANGAPNYPVVISLASEAIRDDEISQFTNYVAAGGFLVVGSSAFTRNTNGTARGDFAFANELGLHTIIPGLTNWSVNSTFSKVSNHPLIAHISEGTLIWQMPFSSEETSWPEANHVGNPPTGLPHLFWRVRSAGATVIAQGDSTPYLLVKPFGKGWFIYDAAMQPLLGHGGWAPGMYAYGIFRNAINWAFQSAALPVPKISPWPYQYDAAVIFRHDMEALPNLISSIEVSAQFEHAAGAKGDYFFCTGELRQEMTNETAVVASLQRAVSNYSATIGPHNGGLTNINTYVPPLDTNSYDYWHWGPDEVLDLSPPGYANGKAYALTSLSNSFMDIQGWLPGSNNGGGLRLWVAPYFNATREASYQIQEQLGIKATGDEKLGPFPHWTLSTQTADKRYSFLTLPVSDWFVGQQVAQAMEDGHSASTVQALVDYYYSLGALINLYSHSSSDGSGPAGSVASYYVNYSLSKPRIWSANAAGIYNWWLQRSNAQIIPALSTKTNLLTISLSISGVRDSNTAVELYIPSPAFSGLQVFTNGIAAGGGAYRVNGQTVKILTGTSVTNAQVKYLLLPAVQNDFYLGQQDATLVVTAPGVLANDSPGPSGGSLTAGLITGPANGTLTLNTNGGFTYTPASGFAGVDGFAYAAYSGPTSSNPAAATLVVNPPGDLFFDNFVRPAGINSLAPWTQQLGSWTITNGVLTAGSAVNDYGYAWFDYTNPEGVRGNWTDYSVQARIQFSSTSAWGGGIGGRLDPTTGAHYAAWVYPDASGGGSDVLKLIKFEGWTTWSKTPIATATLPSVGTNWHTVTLTLQGTNLTVFFDGVQEISASDNNFDSIPAYTSGGISADCYTAQNAFTMAVDDVVVSPVSSGAPIITLQPMSSANNAGTTATFTVAASGASLSYQWLKGGSAIAGATTTILTLPSISDANASTYDVVVSNSFGSVVSSPATLTVIDPPVIVSQPLSITNNVNTAASFAVSATGGALNYQWLKNSTTLVNGGNVSGANSPTLTLANVSASDAASYSVLVSNTAGSVTSSSATLTVVGTSTNVQLFTDNFTRSSDPGPLSPWVAQSGAWMVTGGALKGGLDPLQSYGFACITNAWTNYSVQGRIQFPAGGFGGGLGGLLSPTTGAHYAAWVYPEGSQGASGVLKLVKFQTWTTWSYNGSSFTPMQQVNLPAVGTNWHTLMLAFATNTITVYYDSNQVMSVTDIEATPYIIGGISADMWTSSQPYTMIVDDVVVTSLGPGSNGVGQTAPSPRIESISVNGVVVTITWDTVAGHTYQLQFQDSRTGPVWQNLPPQMLAVGPTATATDTIGNSSQRFYRVLVLP